MNFSTYDASLHIRMETGRIQPIWHRIRNFLKRRGWTIEPDAKVNKCIRRYHHLGRKGDLQVAAEYHDRGAYSVKSDKGGCISLNFFQDIVHENRNGGRYDFSRRQKMPHLIRLHYDLTILRLAHFLQTLGFANQIEAPALTAKDQIRRHGKRCWHIKGDLFTEHDATQDYNAHDRDGQRLSPGCTRYLYVGKHLMRGTCYYNINNMWWVVLSHDRLTNVATHNLFSWKPGLPRRKPYTKAAITQHLTRLRDQFAAAQNYERAAQLRDLLKTAA